MPINLLMRQFRTFHLRHAVRNDVTAIIRAEALSGIVRRFPSSASGSPKATS
jgi:hypothetical protein